MMKRYISYGLILGSVLFMSSIYADRLAIHSDDFGGFYVDIGTDKTVGDLKKKIEELKGVPKAVQKIEVDFGDQIKTLSNNKKIFRLFGNGVTVYLTILKPREESELKKKIE